MNSSVIRTVLDNGLTVLIEPMHHAPVVAVQMWVNAGAADEDDACRGVAHLHEHMLFKGTERRGVGEIASAVESVGGDINAWTSHDQTCYHVVLPAAEVGLGIDVLSDALRYSAFDADELARESEVVLEEIRRDADNHARQVFHNMFRRVFSGHGYGLPVLGTEKSVREMPREEILRFYRTFYRPENVTVVVAGDVDPAGVQDHITKHLGDWVGSADWVKPARTAPSQTETVPLTIRHDDTPHVRFACAWPLPGALHDDVAALDMLGAIFGEGEASRLHVSLYREAQVVHSVYAYGYTPQDRGLFTVNAELKEDSVSAYLAALKQELQRLCDAPPTQDELDRVRGAALAQAAYQREVVQGQARKRGFYEVVAGDYGYEEAYLTRLKALTPGCLLRVAQKYLAVVPDVVVQWPSEAATQPDQGAIEAAVNALPPVIRERTSPRGSMGSYGTERIVLPNGATLLVREEPGCPMVAIRSAMPGGRRTETAKTSGISTMLASVWGLAAEGWTAEALAAECEKLGGGIGAFAGRNAAGLRADFPVAAAEQGTALYLANLLTPRFEADDVTREKRYALEAIKARRDQPAAVCFELFAKTLYGDHPYGFANVGEPDVIEALDAPTLEAYWGRLMRPEEMVLVASGGVTESMIALLSEGLASLPCGGEAFPVPAPVVEPRTHNARDSLDKAQVHVVLGALGVTLEDDDRYAIDVLTSVLSGQGGRLFLDLRDRQSLAYSLSASTVEGIERGQIYLYIGTSPDKLDAALGGLRGHLDQLMETLVPADELARAKRYLAGNHAVQLQRTGSRASSMALCEALGLGYDRFTGYPERVSRVTSEDVQRVARQYLSPEKLVQVTVGPEG